MTLIRALLLSALFCTSFWSFAEAVILPRPPAHIWSHPELDNGEKWYDYFKATPLGRVYNLYHDVKEAGLPVDEFSLYDYGDHPNDNIDFET